MKKFGLELKEGVTVKNILAPNPKARHFFGGDDEKKPENIVLTEYEFDLASEDGTILIEYLSRKDYADWKEKTNIMSSVSSYNFPKLLPKVTDSFSKYKTDEKKVFGVFFDPLAHAEVKYPDLAGINDPQLKKAALDAYQKARKEAWAKKKEKAKKKLHQQVDHFIKFLRENNLIT